MPRAIWKGAISFGLVSVPVGLYSATERTEHIRFRLLHAKDESPIDYKRVWIEPGLGVPLAPFQALGARGVVFVCDSSFAALKGGYLPFTHGFEPLPAVYVDRDEGARLRALAMGRPNTRLTLTASRQKAPTHALTAVLPGKSNETLIFNTHTDGQNAFEENAGIKARAAEASLAVVSRAMTLGGGAAYASPGGLERIFRDAQAASVMAPTTDVLKDFLGKAALGLPLL